MTRSTLALAAVLACASAAPASLSRRDGTDLGQRVPVLRTGEPRALARVGDFLITDQTEILLDGRPCKYDQVPEGAVIILLDVKSGPEKVVRKIHFRSQPAPPKPEGGR
jgi:hypothetical protein